MKYPYRIIVPGVLAAVGAHAAEPLRLKKDGLEVLLDPAFPRIVSYQTPAGRLAGQPAPSNGVLLNDKPAACKVACSVKGPDTAVYQLDFHEAKVRLDLGVTVTGHAVDLRVTRLAESGSERVRTLAFPGNSLLTVDSSLADATLASCFATNMNDQFGATFRERIVAVSSLKAGDKDTGNYLFVSAGGLAAGLGCGNFTDIRRSSWVVSESGGVKSLSAQNPVWEFRMFDDEKPEMPWVKVFVTPDINGDAKADWQDAAIAFRRGMPKPFGHEFVSSTVGENIAMNFASGAQQPFLKILDEVKRMYLATDGLSNQVVIKGFSSEGHDSANTDYADHWNERAGGLRDFTTLLNEAGKYKARIGIHINASEAYPEARRYQPEILRRDAAGRLQGGWTWLDSAHMIDKVKDVRSGQLFSALEKMRKDLPKLDFVYVDTYWEHGWPAAKTAKKINSLGLPMYSEGDCCIDPWITWGHWRGTKHTIQRFLWFSDRDLFANDPILRAGRADQDGFMGWQNQHKFQNFVRNTFTQKLPAKFLQSFELMRWEPGKSAVFSDGVTVEKAGDTVTVAQAGAPVMTWTGSGASPRLFVPWPAKRAEKIYAWSDVAGAHAWQLPAAWKGTPSVRVYELTPRGRAAEMTVPVVDGKVTLDLKPQVPYVIYRKPAPAVPSMVWGEGGCVRDPGFDSYGFGSWKADGNAGVEDDANGNPRLVITGKGGVSQRISGLKPGKTYAATVWAQTTGDATARLLVESGGTVRSNHVTRGNVRHSAPNDPRTGTHYQRLRVVFTAASGTTVLSLGCETTDMAAKAEFDDVRVVETRISPEAAKHFFWEDFENVETGGYGPFTGCPGERTHLSESNPPHTRDTIHGRYSLKSRDGGQVLRTLPSSLRLKPATRYRITCQTIGNGRLTAVSKGGKIMELKFPNLPDYQPAAVTGGFVTRQDPDSYLALFRDGGDFIAIDDLAIDEVGPATAEELAAPMASASAIPDEKMQGLSVLADEKFDKPMGVDWTMIPSKLPGTFVGWKDGALKLDAYAHISILAERKLPAGVRGIECRLTVEEDKGETWGPGVSIVWPDGRQIRVNLRTPDGKFGVDASGSKQQITGRFSGTEAILRIRLDDSSVIAEARCADGGWQKLATLPRSDFPGDPSKVRLGKMHGVEALDDHSDPGPAGSVSYSLLRWYGR